LSGGEICRQTGCIEAGFLIVVPDGHLGKWGQGFQKDRMEKTNNDGMKKCQYCKGGCIRKGMRDGIQMFRCKTCARYQRDEYRCKAHEPGTDDRIALYVREGVGIGSTARIMKISPTTANALLHEERGDAACLRGDRMLGRKDGGRCYLQNRG
jgi:transposase-like protein